MTYDEFRQSWIRALRESGLPPLGMYEGTETLDLRSMARTFETVVEPVTGQDAEPFHVAATLSWKWDPILTARSWTNEEDMLAEVLDRENARRVKTTRPWLRVDVMLAASLPYGKPLPMPAAGVWARWAQEATERLERVEPIVPEEVVREGRGGRMEFLAWQGDPVAQLTCGPDGELRLERVELSSWQAIELPRTWDDPDRKPDPGPHRQLTEMFARVKSALHAWMEVTDHLRAGAS